MKQFACIIAFALLIAAFTSCSTPVNTTNSQEEPGNQSEPLALSQSFDNSNGILEIKTPEQLIGKPDKIILLKGEEETIFEPGTEKYESILINLKARLPEKFDEAACAFVWLDDNFENIDWAIMAQDFDYLRLVYNEKQNVKICCFGDGYIDYTPEVSFQNITFPLTDSRLEPGHSFTKMCIIESRKFLGILDNTEETMAKLLM